MAPSPFTFQITGFTGLRRRKDGVRIPTLNRFGFITLCYLRCSLIQVQLKIIHRGFDALLDLIIGSI
jgi:hypothetical protein